MKKTVSLLVAILCLGSVSAQNFNLFKNLKKGEFKVGFKHEILNDYSRTFDKENKYRPIQLTVWYPASSITDNKPLLYDDYVQLFHKDKALAIKQFKKDPLQYGAKDSILDQILRSKTLAYKDAKAQIGSFPLVLFTPGIDEKSYSNAILCEMLASNGYIVASTSYVGAYSSIEENAPTIYTEPQIRDLEFILAYMRDFGNVDFEKIGLMGHSAGGNAALVLALRNFNIDAIALLDGSFVGMGELSEFSYFKPKYLTIPYLHFISGYWRKKGEVSKDFSNQFFDGITGIDAYTLDMLDLLHQSFVSDMHLRFDNSGIDYKKLGFDVDEKKTDESYQVISELVLTFFNHYLKKENINFLSELEKLKKNHPDIFEIETKPTIKN